jgi:hypothetical protein
LRFASVRRGSRTAPSPVFVVYRKFRQKLTFRPPRATETILDLRLVIVLLYSCPTPLVLLPSPCRLAPPIECWTIRSSRPLGGPSGTNRSARFNGPLDIGVQRGTLPPRF